MTYLVPPLRLSERQRAAVRSVAGLMEVGDEERQDDELRRQESVEEDRHFDPASGAESPSTLRILDAYNELRQQRQREADASDDFFLAETDADEALLAEQTDDAARTAKATESVAQRMNAGVVRYNDETEEPAISPDDYEAFDRECLSDFPETAKPVRQAPAPAPVADDGDDGFDEDRGPYAGPRRASEPPAFNPNG